jgi:hypothetical protein
MTFKSGDYVFFQGYKGYQSTFGKLTTTNSGHLSLMAILKLDGTVGSYQQGILYNSDGQNISDLAAGVLLRKATKSEYTRFLRQAKQGIINLKNQ